MQREQDITKTVNIRCAQYLTKEEKRTCGIFTTLLTKTENAGGGLQEIAPPTKKIMIAYDQTTGRVVDSDALQTVDKIIELRNTKSPWEVIDYLIPIWYEKSPEDAEGTMITIKDLKETRKDQEYGRTDDKNMDRRLVLLFPTDLQALIRKVYKAEELPFDKAFFEEFGNRYRAFRIPEKI